MEVVCTVGLAEGWTPGASAAQSAQPWGTEARSCSRVQRAAGCWVAAVRIGLVHAGRLWCFNGKSRLSRDAGKLAVAWSEIVPHAVPFLGVVMTSRQRTGCKWLRVQPPSGMKMAIPREPCALRPESL